MELYKIWEKPNTEFHCQKKLVRLLFSKKILFLMNIQHNLGREIRSPTGKIKKVCQKRQLTEIKG